MKRISKIIALLLVVTVLAATLAACGKSAQYFGAATEDGYYVGDYATETEAMEAPSMAANAGGGNKSISASEKTPTAEQLSEKIIYTAGISMEAIDFDAASDALTASVKAIGGFVENSSVYGDTVYDADGSVRIVNRNANFTFRIPVASFDAFLAQAGEIGNVTSKNVNAMNVTSQYTDYEARLDSLRTEQTRLLELLEKADNIDALIALENKLTDVRYEIDAIERNLRNLDNQIAYSTVDVFLHEVTGYRTSVSAQRTLWQRIADAFVSGWQNLVEALGNFIVFLSGAFFGLVILAIIIVVIIRIIRGKKKKPAEKQEESKE